MKKIFFSAVTHADAKALVKWWGGQVFHTTHKIPDESYVRIIFDRFSIAKSIENNRFYDVIREIG